MIVELVTKEEYLTNKQTDITATYMTYTLVLGKYSHSRSPLLGLLRTPCTS